MEASRVSALVGVHYKVLDYWARHAGIAPSTEARGKGTRRAYSFADIVGLRLAVRMRAASIPLAVIAAVVAHVRERAGLGTSSARLPGVWLAVSSDGERVFELAEGDSFPGARTNQRKVLHLVPLGDVVAEVANLLRAETVAPAQPLRARPLASGRRYR